MRGEIITKNEHSLAAHNRSYSRTTRTNDHTIRKLSIHEVFMAQVDTISTFVYL